LINNRFYFSRRRSRANAAVCRGHDPDKTEPPSERFWPFPAGRLTASRPDFHHLGGHNPITSQRAFNAAFASFATLRIALAHWRETIRAAAPDPELGGDIGGNPRMGRNLA
jgi:hypothetical protein